MSEALKGMVLAGHGIGWLPESCITRELSEGNLVGAGSDACTTELEIRLYRSGKQRGRAAEQLWSYVEKMTAESAVNVPPETWKAA